MKNREKGEKRMQKFLRRLERFSQSLLSPLSYLSAAGLLLVLGALLTSKPLCQALPVLQWAPLQLVGQLLYNWMMVLINNLSVILCVGVAAVRAKTEKQDAALLALMAYLVFLTANHTALETLGLLAQPNGMTGLAGTGQTTILGIQVVDTGVASGIVLGFAAAWLFNRTCEKQFYGMITQLYSGLRWSFLWLSALAVALGLGFCFVCPPLQRAVSALTGWIAASGNAGVFLYGFLERLLIPTGLHHLIYMPFQFSSLGGSLTVGSVTYTGAYAVCMTEYTMGLPLSDGIVWMYTGFTKTFGYLGIAAAFIFTARRENRARTAAAMIPLAVTASVASITEPIDFLFCFVSPLLWVAHAVITGGFMVLLHVLHVRAFTSNLLGSLVFNLSAGEQLQNLPLLYLLGLAEILTYFAVFSILIKAKNLPTPGREAAPSTDQSPYADPQEVCQFIAALGGPENIAQLGNCFTRLRLTVRDASLLDMGALLSLPHKGLVVQGTRVQLVCGLHAAQLRHALEQQLAELAPV